MKVAVFDTETTGIPDRLSTARIVEVGAVVVSWEPGQEIEILGEFESLARPQEHQYRQPQHAGALRFNGLTVADIDRAPPDYVVGALLEEWLGTFGQIDVVGAFSVDFDFDARLLNNSTWLRRWLKRHPVGPCLMLSAQDAMEVGKWPRLSEACAHYGIEPGNAHTALDDARAAAHLIPHVWPVQPWRTEWIADGLWARWSGERAPMPRGR